MPQYLVVLAHHGSTYQLRAINHDQIVSINHIDEHTTEIALVGQDSIRVAHGIRDVLEMTSHHVLPSALKIYQSLKQ